MERVLVASLRFGRVLRNWPTSRHPFWQIGLSHDNKTFRASLVDDCWRESCIHDGDSTTTWGANTVRSSLRRSVEHSILTEIRLSRVGLARGGLPFDDLNDGRQEYREDGGDDEGLMHVDDDE